MSGVTLSSTTGQMRLSSRRYGPVQKVAPFPSASFTCKVSTNAVGGRLGVSWRADKGRRVRGGAGDIRGQHKLAKGGG